MQHIDKTQTLFLKVCPKTEKPAASLRRRKHPLGLQIHIKVLFKFINIDYAILVLSEALYRALYCPVYCPFLR